MMKSRPTRVYQCIGGPMCGVRVPMSEDGWMSVRSKRRKGEEHYYRMCVVQNSRGRVAKFWHYVGEEPNPHMHPRFFPSNKYFR